MAPPHGKPEVLEVCGHELRVSNPDKVWPVLELAARDEREGLVDAPWPPHFRKQEGEPRRVQPSRARA